MGGGARPTGWSEILRRGCLVLCTAATTGFGAADIGQAQLFFETWLRERRRASQTGPSDPDQVRVADILEDYAREHGGELSSPATLAWAIEPMIVFFRYDTIATLTPERAKEYWEWRRRHSVRGLNRERTEVEVVERGAGDGTIIRELACVLRPAIHHAIKQRVGARRILYPCAATATGARLLDHAP